MEEGEAETHKRRRVTEESLKRPKHERGFDGSSKGGLERTQEREIAREIARAI